MAANQKVIIAKWSLQLIFCTASARPAYASFYWTVTVSLVVVLVKNKFASTKYQLKLSILCDLLEIIICTLGPEASGGSS